MSLARTALAGAAVLGLAATVLAGAAAMAYVRQVAPTLPDHMAIAAWHPKQGTSILARDGTLIGLHASEKREFVPLASIPMLVVNAFLAAEDANYWEHSGIDPTAIARAAISNLGSAPGDRPEGGSTITQQVIKNVILSPERTFDRKIREALLALRADRDVGKERVLEIYLNQIYFGAGAYGVAVAARTYFGKELNDLDIAEAALLAGLPKAPSAANPFSNPARAAKRRAYVLGRMFDEGFISREERAAAASRPLPERPSAAPESLDPAFWHPQEAVRKMLLAEVGADRLYGDGGEIVTTIVPSLQRAVHRELRKGLVTEDRRSGWRGPLGSGFSSAPDWQSQALAAPAGAEDWLVGVVAESGRDARLVTREGDVTIEGSSLGWATASKRADAVLSRGDAVLVADFGNGPELVQIPLVEGAAVVLDPHTGAVLAIDGGFSHETSEFDRASQARRQTGSAFKPFVYLAALEMGYDAMSPVLDSPIAIEQGGGKEDWRPKSGNDGGLGLITLRRSLEMSRNMSTVRLLHDVGTAKVGDVARRAGFSLPPDLAYSMALGAAEATPLEVAAGYAALANGGNRVHPTLVLAQAAAPGVGTSPDLDPVAVAQLTSILEGVVTSGTARRAFEGFGPRIAAKTGTTDEARDAWLAAYGTGVVAVAWIGRDDHKPLAKGASGSATAAPVIREILEAAEGIVNYGDFMLPQGATTVRADRNSGMPDPDGGVIEIVREENDG